MSEPIRVRVTSIKDKGAGEVQVRADTSYEGSNQRYCSIIVNFPLQHETTRLTVGDILEFTPVIHRVAESGERLDPGVSYALSGGLKPGDAGYAHVKALTDNENRRRGLLDARGTAVEKGKPTVGHAAADRWGRTADQIEFQNLMDEGDDDGYFPDPGEIGS